MPEDQAIERLMELKLSKYEAKAYVALRRSPKSTAYELSKISGVPQAKIYETMGKLLEKNLVNKIGDNPTRYVAMDIDFYLNHHQEKVDESVRFIQEYMQSLAPAAGITYLLHINEKASVKEKVRAMLETAEEFVYLEAWREEYEEWLGELKDVIKRKIDVVSVVYGKVSDSAGDIFYHEMAGLEEQSAEVGRWFTLVKDGREAIFVVFEENEGVQAIWTENKAFMLMAESFISHDIFLAEIYRKHKKLLDKDFGENMQKIRRRIRVK